MRVELGARVVVAEPGFAGLWHIPDPADQLEERTLCGLEGLSFVYRGELRARRGCAVCRVRGPELLAAAEEDAEDDGLPERRRGGKPKGKYRRVTDVQLLALHKAYTELGLSCRELGRRVYEQLGYRSARSCGEALYVHFREAGLPLRSQSEVTVARNRRHGRATRALRDVGGDHGPDGYRAWLKRQEGRYRPQCAGVKSQYPGRGRHCTRPAKAGSDFCSSHDPATQADRLAHLERMRARAAERIAA